MPYILGEGLMFRKLYAGELSAAIICEKQQQVAEMYDSIRFRVMIVGIHPI